MIMYCVLKIDMRKLDEPFPEPQSIANNVKYMNHVWHTKRGAEIKAGEWNKRFGDKGYYYFVQKIDHDFERAVRNPEW